MADNLDGMTEKELAQQLGQLGLEVTDSCAVLCERLRKALNADTEVNSRDMLNGAGASNASAQKNMADSRGSSSGARPKERYGGKSVDAMTKKELQEILGAK